MEIGSLYASPLSKCVGLMWYIIQDILPGHDFSGSPAPDSMCSQLDLG